eukprot:6194295-Pleurochrysis_carterae.AAC.1
MAQLCPHLRRRRQGSRERCSRQALRLKVATCRPPRPPAPASRRPSVQRASTAKSIRLESSTEGEGGHEQKGTRRILPRRGRPPPRPLLGLRAQSVARPPAAGRRAARSPSVRTGAGAARRAPRRRA